MPRVFLSRALRADSPFQGLLRQPDWQLAAQSLLRFTPVAVEEVPEVPWLFFYSARGVMAFFRQHTPLVGQKIACLGPGAARCLAQYDYVADFVGNGVPEQVARDLQKNIGTERIAFLQARRSRASVQHLLANFERTLAVVVYDNQPLSDFTLAPADYLIFTSPLNFQAYQQRYAFRPEQRLIGIGNTTGHNFSQTSTVKQFKIAAEPSEQALLDCLLAWEQEYPINHSFFR